MHTISSQGFVGRIVTLVVKVIPAATVLRASTVSAPDTVPHVSCKSSLRSVDARHLNSRICRLDASNTGGESHISSHCVEGTYSLSAKYCTSCVMQVCTALC